MGMMNYFIFNNESSKDLGIYVGGQDSYNAPQRDVTKYSIPGRNGDLTHDNGRFNNVLLTYHVVIMDNFEQRVNELHALLLSATGYVRLEDTYHPEYYRLARVASDIKYKTSAWNRAGKTKITFDCKPQKFLKSGDIDELIGTSGTIYNPTRFNSNPIITFNIDTPSGTRARLIINNSIIDFSDLQGVVTIDCENKTCYCNGVNASDKMSANEFPYLLPGNNDIKVVGQINNILIKGRWWTI